ncbi:blue-sensitive opsin-like [Electrophorus electricus]|uniref:blue-sensitive opsin-like n=1 Tax=Electrophorus electricus TaxID=8005 RepID=UPI0015CFBB1B|nr:blue-sensitive opsin-like [Electrophorus electricus]
MNGTEGADFYVPVSNASGVVRSPYEHTQYYLAESWVFGLLATYTCFLTATAVCGNLLMLRVTVEHEELRTPVNYILLNLAVANIAAATCGYPAAALSAFGGYLYLGQAGCNFEGFYCTLGGQVSLWSLAALLGERALVARRPAVKRRVRRRLAVGGVGVAWLMAFSAALPPLLEISRYIPEGLQCSCGVDVYTNKPGLENEAYVLYLFTLHLAVPLSAIAVCSVPSVLVLLTQQEEEEGETTRTALTLTAVFLACWTPYAATTWHVFTHHGDAFSPVALTITAFLAKSSVLWGPLICICMCKRFRKCARRTVHKLRTGKELEDEVGSASAGP